MISLFLFYGDDLGLILFVSSQKNRLVCFHRCWVRITLCLLAFIRATSHTGLRARHQDTSSTLIGGNGRAGPSLLLHTALEGPMEYIYVNARWM